MGETPEKRPANPLGVITAKKPPVTMKLSAACSESVSLSSGEKSTVQKSEECARFTGPTINSATVKTSPQKQVSLTSYFKPVNKKRQVSAISHCVVEKDL